jgi:glycosyltransferase involved in cell wall biosynthesis
VIPEKKVLIFIVAFNAERFIDSVIKRIPEEIISDRAYQHEVLIIDDCSSDRTYAVARKVKDDNRPSPLRITVMRNPVNLGYGGNQKLGYHYAIENGFNAVVLLHGDGQYAPEILPQIISPILAGNADFVIGSRMLTRSRALKGGMPLYKFLGNVILSKTQNHILGSSLSEFHSGYRAYSVTALKAIPFEMNSNDFDFDTDILIQLLDNGFRCREVDIPTYYGEEICHVNGMKYAFDILISTVLSRLQRFGIYYHPKFDYEKEVRYPPKLDFDSSHTYAVTNVQQGSVVLDIGCGSGYIARELYRKGCEVYGVDFSTDEEHKGFFKEFQQCDINECDLRFSFDKLDYILLMDVVEHLDAPEKFFLYLRSRFARYMPKILITTGNVGFFPMRISLLLGQFNYGKRGILDMTHRRLLTFSSLLRTLRNCGYRIEKVEGIPAPFPLVLGNNAFSRLMGRLNRLLMLLSRGTFSYQIAVEAVPEPTVVDLLEAAQKY